MVTASAGDGSTTVVGYDAAGRVNQIQPPAGLNFTLGTSPAGRYTAFAPPMVDGDASIETSSYDKDGQISAISGLGRRSCLLTNTIPREEYQAQRLARGSAHSLMIRIQD